MKQKGYKIKLYVCKQRKDLLKPLSDHCQMTSVIVFVLVVVFAVKTSDFSIKF